MRAAPLLAGFAALDLLLVALGGVLPAGSIDVDSLRRPLLSILVFTGLGVVALAGLPIAARWLARLSGDATRAIGGLAVGGAYAVATLGSLAWAALWFSPTYALVALAGLVCAGLLLWQLWAEAEMDPSSPRKRGSIFAASDSERARVES
jgi:hypothetical protein